MLARYTIYRVPLHLRREPLPEGIRRDTRYYRPKHPLHPTEEMVKTYLANPTDQAWTTFRRKYLAVLAKRFRESREPFDSLAAQATEQDVFIGCSCPTKANPRVDHCHTFLALQFMKEKYPSLHVEFPAVSA